MTQQNPQVSHWLTLGLTAVLVTTISCSQSTPPKPAATPTDAVGKTAVTTAPVQPAAVVPPDQPAATQPTTTTQPTTMTAGAGRPNQPVIVADIAFTPPLSWKAVQTSSSMRAAQFDIDGKGEAVVYFFGSGQGGDVNSNVQRWLSQFSALDGEPATAVRHAADLALTIVRARGTYQSGMPGASTTPMPNWSLVGIIIASPGGPVFIKITGPIDTITSAEPQIEELLRTVGVPG